MAMTAPPRRERLETLGVGPSLGQLLFNFGLVWLIVAILAAWLLAFVAAGLFSEMGREVPLTALIVARRTYEHAGAFVFSLLSTVVLSTLLAVAGILSHISSFLNSIGDALFPFTFVMLVDWLYVQRRSTPAQRFFEPPRALPDWLSLPAAIAFCVGCAFSFWFGKIAPTWWVHHA